MTWCAAGKARYIGASSMFAWQFAKALFTSDLRGYSRFVTMQNHYNLLYREEEREMIPLCLDQRIGVLPWSPLGRGLLSGKRVGLQDKETKRAHSDGKLAEWYDDANLEIAFRLAERAAELGYTPAQVAIAWLLHKPAVSAPVAGATKLQHLDDLVKAVTVQLSSSDLEYLEAPYIPREIQGHQ